MDKSFISHPDLKLLFICSPGNPTGTLIPLDVIKRVLENKNFKGVVVVDEAYIDFAQAGNSAASLVNEYANVCVTQTLSKSFGLAAIRWVILHFAIIERTLISRLGYLLAPPPLIQILTNTKAPYNISLPTASLASQAVSTAGLVSMANAVNTLNANRQTLIDGLNKIPGVGVILGGNHANFVMAQITKDGKPSNELAVKVYKTMAEHRGVVVRYRGGEIGCEGCLRVTVGSEEEVEQVLKQLGDLLK